MVAELRCINRYRVVWNPVKHKHHIIPKHMGGTDAPSNIIELSIEEHAEAHRRLYEEHGCWEDKIAYQALEGSIGNEEIIFKVLSESGKRGGAAGKGKTSWNKGKTGIYSEETLKKMSEAPKHEWTTEMREAQSKRFMGVNKGKKRSEEFCKAQSERLTGKKQSPLQAAKSRENAIGNKSRTGQKRSAEELKKLSETLKEKYASGEMIHWTKRPEHAHRFKKGLD